MTVEMQASLQKQDSKGTVRRGRMKSCRPDRMTTHRPAIIPIVRRTHMVRLLTGNKPGSHHMDRLLMDRMHRGVQETVRRRSRCPVA